MKKNSPKDNFYANKFQEQTLAYMKQIKIFAPATIANVSCGFDILGLCLDSVGDEMIIRESKEKGIKITKIVGQDLPLETEKNVAGVAGLSLLKALNSDALISTHVSPSLFIERSYLYQTKLPK